LVGPAALATGADGVLARKKEPAATTTGRSEVNRLHTGVPVEEPARVLVLPHRPDRPRLCAYGADQVNALLTGKRATRHPPGWVAMLRTDLAALVICCVELGAGRSARLLEQPAQS